MEVQADQIELANYDRRVRLGLMSIEEMAKATRDDMDAVPLWKVRQVLDGQDGLPLLPPELPEFQPAVVGGDEPGGGGSTSSPSKPDSQNVPADEATKQYWPLSVTGNGNGKGH